MKYENPGCPYRSPGTPVSCLGPLAFVNVMGAHSEAQEGAASVHRRRLLGGHMPVETRFFTANARVSCSIVKLVSTGKEASVGTSLVNRVEAEMVMCLFKELTSADPALRSRPAIAVISPYKAQVRLGHLSRDSSAVTQATAASTLVIKLVVFKTPPVLQAWMCCKPTAGRRWVTCVVSLRQQNSYRALWNNITVN